MSHKKSASNGTKLKKCKTDICKTTLAAYLKQRHYEGQGKHGAPTKLVQSSKEFVLQNMLEGDLVTSNCFTFSNVVCISNNQQLLEQQFSKFSRFVESQPNTLRSELRRFYGPIICHLAIELLKAREPIASMKFLRKYANLLAPIETLDTTDGTAGSKDDLDSELALPLTAIKFIRDEDEIVDNEQLHFMSLIENLSHCSNVSDINQYSQLTRFRSSKYEIHTTQDVVNTLIEFLEKQGHVAILNLLVTWIRLHVINNEISSWSEEKLFFEHDHDENEIEKSAASNKNCDRKGIETVRELELEISDNMRTHVQNFLDSKTEILKAQKEFCRIIKLCNKNKGLTSADVDVGECHVVAGYADSSVQLWQLNQQSYRGRNMYDFKSDSVCSWELNNSLQQDESAIDAEIRNHANKTDWRQRNFEQKKYEENSFNDYGGIKLCGHGLGVTDVQFSTHFPLLYSVSKDKTMRCWQADSFRCAAIYRGHSYPIWCLDESSVRMYLATGSKDLTARIWSLDREHPLITFTGHTQDIECIAFHPNGNYFATGSADLSVRLWCIASGKLMRVFHDFKQPITTIKFSPNGRYLAVGGEEMKVHIYDLAIGAQFVEYRRHSACISSIAWNQSSSMVASVCKNGSLCLWDVEKVKPLSHDGVTDSIPSMTTVTHPLLQFPTNCDNIIKILYGENHCFCGIGY